MQPTDYQEIGHYLRDSRESLRVPLSQAARDLNIRAKYLEYLESGSLNELPGKTYIRGYIRNYAQYLRLDVDKVLDAYAPVLGPRTAELFIPEPTLRQNLPTRRLIWLSLGGLAVLYAYWYFNFHDRRMLEAIVADLPPAFAHLLDKPMPGGMDRAWEECLSAEDVGCAIFLKAEAPPPTMVLYDIKPSDGAPKPDSKKSDSKRSDDKRSDAAED